MDFNIAMFSRDLLILIVPSALIFLTGFFIGRDKAVVLFFSTFISYALTNLMPFDLIKNITNLEKIKLAVFIGLILAGYLALSGTFLKPMTKKKGKGKLVKRIIYAIILSGLIISNIVLFIDLEILNTVPVFNTALASTTARFTWFTLAFISMTLIKKKKED